MALELLADMKRRGVEPDVVTYNSLINVLRWGGQRDRALEILDGMNAKGAGGVRPDVITYNSAIAACASGYGGGGVLGGVVGRGRVGSR